MFGSAHKPLAIVGMACRLPGANNLAEYWRMLIEGRSAIGEIPPDRFNQELYYDPVVGTPGKSYSKLAAVLASRDFNRELCPMDERLEKSADITHLMMCETAATALRQAKMDPFDLAGRNVGVYIGHVHGSSRIGDCTYATFIEEAAEFLHDVDDFRKLPQNERQAVIKGLLDRVQKTRPLPTGDGLDVASSMAAGVVSKAFGLSGPFLSLDSACASSLQALLFASRALQMGQIDMAIVGGASDCKPTTLVLFSFARALSATGSRPFDADADGMICAEGYVSIVLKTLDRAIADGDPIQAVIRGLGVSSDGRGKSLWAPRREGQVKAMQRAYGPGVDMSSLQYIEAHATATQVGDATELQTLAEILTPHIPSGEKIPIGSAKANIGHTLESAGIASLIKTVLSLQHGLVPPLINLRNLNPKVDWNSAPFYVPTTLVPWPAVPSGQPRRAGVNAFGIGGLNMHVILEEFEESKRGQARLGASADPYRAAAPTGISKQEEDAVAVVGMGCLFPGSLNVERFWELLTSGRDPKQAVPPDRWRLDVVHSVSSDRTYHRDQMIGGFMTDFQYDWKRHKVPPKQIANADPLQFWLLEATDQAMRDAGYDKTKFDRTRTGVVVGTEFGGDFGCQLLMGLRLPETEEFLLEVLASRGIRGDLAKKIAQGYASALLSEWTAMKDETGSFTASTLASRLAKTWDLMGGAAAIDSGSTSALTALGICFNALLIGDCDTMICAAGQRRMAWPEYEMLDRLNVLATERPVRSMLDAQATGIVPGEGVGALVLKRLSQARRDGDRIRAVIRGVRAAHAPSWGDALKLAMERVFQTANVTPAEVSCMEFDGAGLHEQIDEQLNVVASHFGQDARSQPVLISSITSQIGHTHGASGMASLIKANLELESGEMSPTVGFDQPTPIIAEEPSKIATVVDRTPIRHTTNEGTRVAAVSSASRGMVFCAVVEGGERKAIANQQIAPASLSAETSSAASSPAPAISPSASPTSSEFRICRIGAANREGLLSTLHTAGSNGSLYGEADAMRFSATDRVRLAIVADGPESCQQKLQLARQHIGNPAAATVLEQQGVFLREPAGNRPRIAFVFPGQGSQYIGMLQQLVREVPAAARAMSDADQIMIQNGFPTFAQLAWASDSAMGTEVWPTQVAVLLADHIVHAAITGLGIQAEVVLGHSYGELPALLAGGAWDFETAVRVTRARCEGIARGRMPHGKMMATTATPDVIDTLISRVEGPVYVATHNAPDQTVVGGTGEALAQIGELLRANNYQTRIIPVPCAFHTPLMHDANGPLEEALRTANIQRPRVTTFTWVTNRPVESSCEIRTRLLAHYTTPVWYVDLIRSIAKQGDTVFVEVGPNQICTRLHQRILSDDGTALIACDNPKRPGVQQLWHVRALLECAGALDGGGNGSPQPTVSATQTVQETSQVQRIPYFDATARRRDKMRKAAMSPTAKEIPTSDQVERAPAPSSRPSVSSVAQSGRATQSDMTTERQERTQPDTTPVIPESKPAPAPTALRTSQLEQFLIAFVVEQTGYPPDVVELDADLEADLGIDSIKRVQLFAELQPYFEVQATEDLTLDDFPTLRHVVDFLKDVPIKQPLTPDSTSSVEAPAMVAAAEPAAATAASEESAAPVADTVSPTPTSATDTLQLESFLVNFVVEQTGYPPDVVELDADLEADLGIDSIKRVQLFAELQPYFDVQPTEDLTLDDFPTLRHVVDFLKDVPIKQPLGSDEDGSAHVGTIPSSTADRAVTGIPSQSGTLAEQPATVNRAEDSTDDLEPAPAVAGGITDLTTSSAYRTGQQRAEQLKDEVLKCLRQIADSADGDRDTFVVPEGAIKDPARYFGADQLDELRGMADALQMPLGNIVAYHFAATSSSAPAESAGTDASQSQTARWDLDDDPTASTTERFQLRMLHVPLPVEAPQQPQWQGPALVIGQNAAADALRDRLALDGVPVLQISSSVETDIDQALDEFDHLWRQQAIPHLFILSGRDAEAEKVDQETAWGDRYRRGVLMPMLICQRWISRAGEANMLDRCTLVSAVQLGGDFGFSGYVTAPEGGALTGLTKALYLEKVAMAGHRGLCVKAIDAATHESPEDLARNIIRELAAHTVDYEVAFVDGERFLQNAYSVDVLVKEYADICRGETWVVTGGARGITAECALELGRRFGLKLHLIGTSPFPQIEPAWRNLGEAELDQLRSTTMLKAREAGELPNVAWQSIEKAIEIDRTLRRLEDAGIQVTYHVCDVSDRHRLAAVLEQIRRQDGPIEGIVHGAGIDRSCRFENKTREGVEATFRSKVVGAYHLMTLTRQDPIRHFVAFGSISGRLGSNGQADYCAASDMLCKLVSWQRTSRPDCRCIAFHFHPWDDVGMASRPEVKSLIRAAHGPVPMPKHEGVRHFLRELYAGSSSSEVLITSREYYERFYGNPEESLRQRQESEATATSASDHAVASAESMDDRLTRRLVLRMCEKPLDPAAAAEPKLDGTTVIVGDNPPALALRDRLQAYGASVFIIRPEMDPDDAVSELNRLWEQKPISHVFLMTPHDGDVAVGTDAILFDQRCRRGVLVPFVLCQQWIRLLKKASMLDKAKLYACTALGGDFGISGNVAAIESGGLTGLIKSLHIEFAHNLENGISVKAIDFDSQASANTMATAICRELAGNAPNLEVGYTGGKRHVAQIVAQPLESSELRRIPEGGTWIVSGGARGITAVAALAMGKRFGLRLHLLGTSPPPQIEDSWRNLSEKDLQQLKITISRQAHEKGLSPRQAWKQVEKAIEIDRSLRTFREAGVRVTYHCCDVTDRGRLSEVLARVRELDGPIEGIIHGAGIAVDARFENKKRQDVFNTIATKAGGAVNLLGLTAEDPLRFFVGFGSVSGRFGARGQSDYASANDMLCKQIDWLRRQRPDCVAIGIHWHGWDEVGMAVQPDVKANFEKKDYRLMPTREGVAHLIDELTMGGTESEVIFTDAPQLGTPPRPTSQGAPGQVDGTGGESPTAGHSGAGPSTDRPMIDRVTDCQPGLQVKIETQLDPSSEPFLIDHKMGDRPLLPAVIGMELCAEAASLIDDRQIVGLRDVQIHAPLPFANDRGRAVRVKVTAKDTDACCELTSDLFDRKGRLVEPDRVIMSATAEMSAVAPELSIPYCGLPWIRTFYPFEYDRRRAVVHGPRFQSLKGVYFQYDGGFFRVLAPPLRAIAGSRGDRGWHLAPAVLDACLLGCSSFGLFMFEGRVGLPLIFKRIRFVSQPRAGEWCIGRFYYRGQKDRETFYDFNLFGQDQRLLLAVEGFHTTVIPTWTHTF